MFKLSVLLVSSWLHINPFVQNGFQTYSDIMQFLILFLAIIVLLIKDYWGIFFLLISSLFALGIMLTVKSCFTWLAKNYIDYLSYLSIAKRPTTNDFDGFPSGHTTAAFVAVGFVYKRYGFSWGGGIIFILALLVGISRIYAEKHTVIQVICGAILGFFCGYCLSKNYNHSSHK